MIHIPNYTFTNLEQISKGWSSDKKYCATDIDGIKYFLRISTLERYDRRKSIYDITKRAMQLNISVNQPLDFGTYENSVYTLFDWIDGEDLKTVLPSLSETDQYKLGFESGDILHKFHTLPEPENQEDWATYYNWKIDRDIKKYYDCGIQFEGAETVISYINQNRHLLDKRPQRYQHGDYHIGNMMVENDNLTIIDFDSSGYGDPWEEFNRIPFSATLSPRFASGQINGYFHGEPPIVFFQLMKLYISSNMIFYITKAIPFGKQEVDFALKQCRNIMEWYDDMRRIMPIW